MTATRCQRVGFAALSLVLGACASEPPAPPPEPPPVSASPVHTTREGESLCAIAGRYGVSASWLASANAVSAPPSQPLKAGLALHLAGADPAGYAVRRGDTLSWIASWTGVSVATLAAHNRIADPDLLQVGTVLRIPPGARTSCEPPLRIAARARRPAPAPEEVVVPVADRVADPAPPPGQPAEPDLVQAAAELRGAEERYADADFAGAAREAAAVREQLADARSRAARELAARAAALEALCHIGRQRGDDAVAAFRAALELDPAFELDRAYASPVVLPVFDEARSTP